jgi:hypothetical protein
VRALGLVAALLIACGQATAPAAATTDGGPAAPLLATVTISGQTASVLLVNRSAGPVAMAGQVLDSAQLLLEVRDSQDHIVPPTPPPTPNGEVRSILAGDRLTRSLSLDVFSLSPGDYTVRVKGDDIESNVAALHIAKK